MTKTQVAFEALRLPARDDFEPYETPDHFKMLLAVLLWHLMGWGLDLVLTC